MPVTNAASDTVNSPIKTVLIFTIDNNAGSENSQVASDIAKELADGLGTVNGYRTLNYSSRLPAVQRALISHPEKKISAAGPFTVDAKSISDAIYLANAIGVDLAITGSLDRCGIDNNTYNVTSTIQVLDIKKKTPIQTITVTGKSEIVADDDKRAKKDVAKNAANKIITEITGQIVTETPAEPSTDSVKPTPVANNDTPANPIVAKKQTIVALPFAYTISLDDERDDAIVITALMLNAEFNKSISQHPMFYLVKLSPQAPSIKRAIKDGTIKAADVKNPVDTTNIGALKARKIAKLMGTQLTAIGSVDRYDFDNEKGQLSMLATIQIIDVKTGKINNMVTVTGIAARKASETEKELRSAAVKDTVQKLVLEFNSPNQASVNQDPAK
ncbi:MAG: hypothetical protein ACYC27_08920 [Armatimonadota bacterium]